MSLRYNFIGERGSSDLSERDEVLKLGVFASPWLIFSLTLTVNITILVHQKRIYYIHPFEPIRANQILPFFKIPEIRGKFACPAGCGGVNCPEGIPMGVAKKNLWETIVQQTPVKSNQISRWKQKFQ